MKTTASDVLIDSIHDWGVEVVFGLPGDGINGIMEALRRHQDRVRFVLVHHEEAAAFMATGYAKATGRLGVCLATSGPGGIHLLNGLYDAKLDHVPVLAITGMQSTSLLGTGFQQEVHLEHLYEDVADYNAMVHVPVQIPALVDNAVRTALAHRTVSHLTFPVDLQEADAELKPYEGGLGTGRSPATQGIGQSSPAIALSGSQRSSAGVVTSYAWRMLAAQDNADGGANTLQITHSGANPSRLSFASQVFVTASDVDALVVTKQGQNGSILASSPNGAGGSDVAKNAIQRFLDARNGR